MGFSNPVVGGTTLRIPAIQSPNYVPGSSGWAVFRDGSAEFNDATVRNVVQVGGQLFLYNGTPAANNMILSVSPTDGTDAYGNPYYQGITSYSPGVSAVNLQNGTVRLATYHTPAAPSWQYGADMIMQNDRIIFQSACLEAGGGDDRAALSLISGDQNTTTGLYVPSLELRDALGNSEADFRLSGSITKSDINGNPLTWHIIGNAGEIAYGTGWAGGPTGGTFQHLQYRKDAEDNLVLNGIFHSTSTTPAATICTLPAGYRPAMAQRVPIAFNSSNTITAGIATITTAGVVSVTPNPTVASMDVHLTSTIPLGNIQ